MTTLTKTVDFNEVVKLLMNASWSWETSGDRVRESDMNEYIDEIEQNISEAAILAQLDDVVISDIINEFDGTNINEFAAGWIADTVAQSLIDCVYQGATFLAIL